jgi:hypothetical protein
MHMYCVYHSFVHSPTKRLRFNGIALLNCLKMKMTIFHHYLQLQVSMTTSKCKCNFFFKCPTNSAIAKS